MFLSCPSKWFKQYSLLTVILFDLTVGTRFRHLKHRHNAQPMSDQPDDDEKPFVFVTISEVNVDSASTDPKRFIELFAQRNPYKTPENHISLFRGWRLVMIRGSTMEIVLSVDLSTHVTEINGPYIVIGDSNVPNIDIRLESPKTERSFTTASFPEMDSSPYAIAVVATMDTLSAELLTLPSLNGAFQPLKIANDESRKHLLWEMTWDIVVVGRKVSTNQCDFFSALFPSYAFTQGYKYLLRDWDSPTSSINDYSLNYCCKDPTPTTPECFKLGHPSPGSDNDCTGRQFILELQMNTIDATRQSNLFVDQNENFCKANFPGVEPYRYPLVHDHDYARAVARVMERTECQQSAEPMDVDKPIARSGLPNVEKLNDQPHKYISEFNSRVFKQECKNYFSKPDLILRYAYFKSWLDVTPAPGKCVISCKICRKYFNDGWRPDQKHKTNLQKDGFSSKSKYDNQKAVTKHLNNPVHVEAVFFYAQLEQASTRTEQLAIEAAQKSREIERLRPTMNEVCHGYTELRAQVSFMCHRQFMNGAHRLGVNVGTKHRNDKSLKNLSVTLSFCFHKRLLEHLVREQNYFSLICDGTTNRNIPYLVCLIQTLENSRPIVYFWGLLVITAGETGYSMVEDLKIRVAEDDELVPGFEDYFKSHIIASVSDSASNMAGSRDSFYTHLSTFVGRRLALVKCGTHKLQRAIIHAVNFPTDDPIPGTLEKDRKRYFKSFTSINNRFYTFYMSRGSKRFQDFIELAEELEIPAYRINYFFDIRWASSHKKCMETMYKNYDALRADLSRISADTQFDQSAMTKAKELYTHLIDKTFPVVVAEFVDFLTVFEIMSLRFQSKGGILIGNVKIIRDGYTDFEKLKHEPGSYLVNFLKRCSCPDSCAAGQCSLSDYDNCLEVLKDDSQKLSNRRDGQHTIKLSQWRSKLYENLQAQLVEYFQPETLEAFEAFNPSNFISQCSPTPHMTLACSTLSACYKPLPTIVPNKVPKSVEDNIRIVCTFYGIADYHKIISDWKALLSEIVRDHRSETIVDLDPAKYWPNQLKRMDTHASDDIKKLIERILVTSFTSADAERAFSMVTSIKTKDQSSMSPTTLQDLVRIGFNGPDELTEENLFEYTKEFVKKTSRVDDLTVIGGQETNPEDNKSYFSKSLLF